MKLINKGLVLTLLLTCTNKHLQETQALNLTAVTHQQHHATKHHSSHGHHKNHHQHPTYPFTEHIR